MAPTPEDRLVTVATAGPQLDGIEFDSPSASKVVVAVMDPGRGPVLRTFSRSAVTERTEPGPDDQALALLIRRTPLPGGAGGGGRGGASGGRGRAGHTRGAAHRPTGR
ncbi:MAG TPA: hypothetical protein VFZ89_17360 [Solirubrobacteraceae bacterium]